MKKFQSLNEADLEGEEKEKEERAEMRRQVIARHKWELSTEGAKEEEEGADVDVD